MIKNIISSILFTAYIGGVKALHVFTKHKDISLITIPFLLYALSWTLVNIGITILTIKAIQYILQ